MLVLEVGVGVEFVHEMLKWMRKGGGKVGSMIGSLFQVVNYGFLLFWGEAILTEDSDDVTSVLRRISRRVE